MKVEITIRIKGMDQIDEIMKKIEEIREKNLNAKVNVEVQG